MICPKCAFQNDDSNYFCIKCGSNLKVAVEEPSVENYAAKAAPAVQPDADPFFSSDNSGHKEYVMSEDEFLKDYLGDKTEESTNDNPMSNRFTIPPPPLSSYESKPASYPEQHVQYGLGNNDDNAADFISSRINEHKTTYFDMPPEHKHTDGNGGKRKLSFGGGSVGSGSGGKGTGGSGSGGKGTGRRGSGRKGTGGRGPGGKGSGPIKYILAGIALLLIIAGVVIVIILHNTDVPVGDGGKKEDHKNNKKTEEETSEKVSDSNLEEITYDIKYSKAGDIEEDGVDFLIKVKNDNDHAVKAIDFSYSIDGDNVKNALDDSDLFYAYGYVKPETEGYMYCRMHVPSGTPKERGKINIVNTYSTDLANYNIPEGVITEQHLNGNEDSYDVDIANNNSGPLSSNSKIIVVCEGRDDQKYPLEDAWGCGDMKEEVAGHEFASISNAITDAGMKHYGEKNYPKVLILDRDMLDVKADE